MNHKIQILNPNFTELNENNTEMLIDGIKKEFNYFIDPIYLNSTWSLIHQDMIEDVTIFNDDGVQRPIFNGHSFNITPNAFQPLDLE